jgi:hypothetical protein
LTLLAPALSRAGVQCVATLGEHRVLVDVTLKDVVGRDLERLIKLGLPGKFRLQVELFRERSFWLDEPQAKSEHTLALTYAKVASRYLLGERSYADLKALVFPRFSLPLTEAPRGRYRVEIRARLQIVTPESLKEVTAWTSEEGSSVPRPLLAALAEGLVHEESGECETPVTK